MTDYGLTPTGFVVKPFADILNAKLDLARSAFGPDVDLRSTSALRKILDIASAEDQEHCKAPQGELHLDGDGRRTRPARRRSWAAASQPASTGQ